MARSAATENRIAQIRDAGLPIHLVIGETLAGRYIACDPDLRQPNPPMLQRTIHAHKATCTDCLNAITTRPRRRSA